ncbi:MAG: metabolite traffic protein EboE [Alphaproteobacteria bacterium]|jgi:sugar phosphate isomerase/epimerase|nr:metabolite traffic protein EboE [Alphaproteobacteria bacterium]MBT4084691.1 metabolite traffic protein EboE [Alphaproteobacteria bacterium]MBT4544647.1 metabolite traffic protein EboE [Alphaproteobacteria bacterium]MBT5920329.1 metabolite traffic protein EboE [Alphaproteobacteria bacterium]MBT7744939.1 metabolite traffic protein EboE [Alphaproteobacteria bacterium]
MKLDPAGNVHLTYCTNIHPGETWPDVRASLENYLPRAKAALVPDDAFGMGLRLSAIAANDLAQPDALAEFKNFLQQQNLYVFTLNGFPYGDFHGTPVKENVYLPDWRDNARLNYTNQLADILVSLLPEGMDGSISTVPGAFKSLIMSDSDIAEIMENMVRHAAHLVDIHQRTGKLISLTLEPEPCCFIETIDESVDFFETWLFSVAARDQLMALTSLDAAGADAALHRHLGLCLDLCHAAVEFEEADAVIRKLDNAKINIGKMQISAGLRFAPVTDRTLELLKPFDDAIYLHQTVANSNGNLTRHIDLQQAFDAHTAGASAEEWRVHFHVPIFLDDLGEFATTQNFIREILAIHRKKPISNHLEVETYTWNVLPLEYRNVDVIDAIVRELNWVREQLASGAEG